MMIRKILKNLLPLFTILFIFSSPIIAEAANGDNDDGNIFYIKPSVNYATINLPDYAPMALLIGIGELSERLTTHLGNDSGMLNTLTLGIESKKKLFFELSGSYSSYASNEYNFFDYPIAIITGWYSLDGSKFPAAFMANNNDIAVNTERDTDYSEINLIAGKHFAVNEKYKIKTFMGYSYARLDQNFETHAYNYQAIGDKVDLNEDITGTYNGLMLGTGLSYSHAKLKSYLNITVTGYYIDADYKGHQVQSNGSGGLAQSYNIYYNDSKSEYKGRLGIESGISREFFDVWELGLDCGFYMSSAPRIIASNKSPVVDGSPTHVEFSSYRLWKFGVNLKYSF